MGEHNLTGRKGEEIAEQFLAGRGYRIIERNWRSGRYEIDLIAEKDGYLVITEVKTRHQNYMESPLESVNLKKQGFLIKATNAYIRKNKTDMEVRFDIVTVVLSENGHSVELTENAFYPLLR